MCLVALHVPVLSQLHCGNGGCQRFIGGTCMVIWCEIQYLFSLWTPSSMGIWKQKSLPTQYRYQWPACCHLQVQWTNKLLRVGTSRAIMVHCYYSGFSTKWSCISSTTASCVFSAHVGTSKSIGLMFLGVLPTSSSTCIGFFVAWTSTLHHGTHARHK